MVHDITSRAAARELLAESGVAPSDKLTEALSELRAAGQRPAPPMSPALAEAMSRAADPATDFELATPTDVVAIGRGNAVENMIDSVIRWAAPTERTEPVPGGEMGTVNPDSIPAPSPELLPAAPLPDPAGQQVLPEPDNANGTLPPETAEAVLPSLGAPGGGAAAENPSAEPFPGSRYPTFL